MSQRAPFQGFVGSAFSAQSQRLDTQDLWNWYVERAQSPYAKSGQVLLPCPGFQTFTTLPTANVRGLWAQNNRTFAVGGAVLYELTNSGGFIARPTTTLTTPAAPVITNSPLTPALTVPVAPTVTHGGALGSTTYGYKITATNALGETAASGEGLGTSGNATLSGTDWNIISWPAVEGCTGYKVYRTTGGATTPPVRIATLASTTLVFHDTGFPGTSATPPATDTTAQAAGTTTYGYKVTAMLGLGETTASAEGTTAAGPAKLTSVDFTIITWTAVTNAEGYQVYRTTGTVGEGLILPPRLIATITDPATLTTNDTGQEGEAVTPPTNNTTGTKSLQDDGFPVSWASSGDAGEQLFIVSGGFGYCYDLESNVFAPVVEGATFGGFIDSYFVALDAGTSTLKVSESFNGFVWDPTQLYQRSRAGDKWLAMAVTSNEIWLIGSQTGEVWNGTGDPDNRFAPYAPVFLETGIGATFTMTRVSGDQMMWVAQDKDGAGYVVRTSGYTPQPVSTSAVDFSIQNLTVMADAFAFSYQQDGHTFYVITFQTDSVTWVFDLSTNEWHRRGDWDPNVRAFLGYRASCHAFAFGGGGHGVHLVGDRSSGIIATIDPTYGFDMDGSVIRRVRQCPHVSDSDQEMTFDRLQMDMEVGLGLASGQGSDPTMMLQYSNDGGKTFGHELWRSAGRQGDYRIQVAWSRLGTAKDRVFRLVVSDPIPWRLVGAWLEAEGS
jgi:hypothetical protein